MAAKVSRDNQIVPAMLFLIPASIGFLAFFLWPTIRGIYLSFTDYNLLRDPTFIGFQNYIDIFNDAVFWRSMAVTFQYVFINVGLQTVIALALAVLMHRFTRSMVIRGVVVLPYLIANVIVALVWFWLADYSLGLINAAIDWLGFSKIGFFGSEAWAMPTIALVNVWRHVGYTALLLFAGLQAIPRDVYEAAEVDGAGEFRVFRSVTLPLLRPVLAFVLVVTVVGSFQIFDTIAVTTGGGPVDATRAINFYIFERAFERFDFGYASALAVILMILLATIALIQNRLLRANESDMER
ncbi:carbohydrate ABC transporter membrane protein 1 (CUT1 family) [Salinibacterium amurskyense]|uniref:Carbohydrate ABC transporter membrane protein 1 (CUT1 family) n=1 Tax=Salinibacterium amurskyense TaxID=205941 RepID=A0A2M9D5N9_9MICO|nr:sugar ABC transporter permease [Salinibacterium amurskyense]PJJ80853.1 carbohydrate ABC transporter membrane protein 1 (CUT1 family) [Salinibacterium amurskyense]RLQ82903.1 sugar ABC transporter permease [Salinibacterium amurskyense]GHD82220.1 sugar ABC transporter permease [Salinibacterium amurskyense]